MLRDRERDIQQRSLGCFGFSVILHACAMAAILFTPQLSILEPTAGARESLGEGDGLNATQIEMIGDSGSGGDASPKAENAKADSVVTRAEEKAPSSRPTEPEKPILVAAAAPLPVPAKKSTAAPSKPKPPPRAAAPAQGKPAPLPSKGEPIDDYHDGDVLAAIAASRREESETKPKKSAPVAAKKPTQDIVEESDRSSSAQAGAPKPSAQEKGAADDAPSSDGKSEKALAAAPVPVAPSREEPLKPAPTASALVASKKAGQGEGQDSGAAAGSAQGAPDGRVGGLAAAAATAANGDGRPLGAPTGVRDAEDLREAPGNPKPIYPYEDRLNGRQGTVTFFAYVNSNGSLREIRLDRGAGSQTIDNSAIAAFRKYRYLPGQEGWIRKSFTFNLKGEAEEVPLKLRRE